MPTRIRPEPVSGYSAQPTNGYPPPPQQQQPNYYYPNPNPAQRYYPPPPPPPPPRTIFYGRVMSALILACIILFIILYIIYLILRPRFPIFTLTSLSLSSLNLTTSPSTSPAQPSLSATWTATFQVTNPNTKLHVYYDVIEARVFYHMFLFAVNQLPPFDQPVREKTAITARLTAALAYIEPGLSRDFSNDRSRGNIKFDVQVLALVRFKLSGLRARQRGLNAFCDGLMVNINGSSGGLSGGPRRCAVVI